MPDTATLATAPVVPARSERPSRAEWQRRMIDGQLDNPPGYVWPAGKKRELLGFALALASFNRDGMDLRPTLRRLADRAGCSRAQAARNREEIWRLGFFEKTGVAGHSGPILAVSDPPGYSPMSRGVLAGEQHNNQENTQSDHDVDLLTDEHPCFHQGKEQTTSDLLTDEQPPDNRHPKLIHREHYQAHLAQYGNNDRMRQALAEAFPECLLCRDLVAQHEPERRPVSRDDPWANEPAA